MAPLAGGGGGFWGGGGGGGEVRPKDSPSAVPPATQSLFPTLP